MREDITKWIDALNDEPATRQESIDILKDRLKNQITSFCETIAKVLDGNTSLAEQILTLFREQGITIASIFMAIGMAISVLIEALLPGGGGGTAAGGEPPPEDEAGLKKWLRSKLKVLASLLGKLGIKAAEALPGIIGAIITWGCSWLGITKLMGSGCRYWRLNLYIYGYQVIILHIVI